MENNTHNPIHIQLPPHSEGIVVATSNAALPQQLKVSYAAAQKGPEQELGTLAGKGEGIVMQTQKGHGTDGIKFPSSKGPATLTLHFSFGNEGTGKSQARKLCQYQCANTVVEVYGSEDGHDQDFNDTVAVVTYQVEKPVGGQA